jgi:hypothetical protein
MEFTVRSVAFSLVIACWSVVHSLLDERLTSFVRRSQFCLNLTRTVRSCCEDADLLRRERQIPQGRRQRHRWPPVYAPFLASDHHVEHSSRCAFEQFVSSLPFVSPLVPTVMAIPLMIHALFMSFYVLLLGSQQGTAVAVFARLVSCMPAADVCLLCFAASIFTMNLTTNERINW